VTLRLAKYPRERLTPRALVDALLANRVTHVIYLPDSEHSASYDALESHPTIELVRVAREGEALGIAAGLWAGGKRPVAMFQNTGLFEAGDSIRGFGLSGGGLPLVMLIGYRGWVDDRNFRDNAALYTEPILRAWGLPYQLIAADADLLQLTACFEEAERTHRPSVALLVEDEGFEAPP
jgi:sulfopyruvate decarboxylase subunit alpha